MFPEAEVIVFAFVPAEKPFFAVLVCPSGRASVGVGGVVVRTGASLTGLAKDFGDDVTIVGRLCMLWFGLRRLCCEYDVMKSVSDCLEPFRKLMLFFFSFLGVALGPFPLPLDITGSSSGLPVGLVSFFRDPVENTSLIFVPGEIPRPSLERLLLEDCPTCSAPSVTA